MQIPRMHNTDEEFTHTTECCRTPSFKRTSAVRAENTRLSLSTVRFSSGKWCCKSRSRIANCRPAFDTAIHYRKTCREKTTTVVSDPSPWSTVAHLHLDELSLAEKPDDPALGETFEQTRAKLLEMGLVRMPNLFDRNGDRALRLATKAYRSDDQDVRVPQGRYGSSSSTESSSVSFSTTTSLDGGWLHIGEAMARQDDLEIEEEVRACFAELECEP